MRASHALVVSASILALLAGFLLVSRRAGADARRGALDWWDEGVEGFVRRRVAGTYVDELDATSGPEAFYRAMKAYVRFDPYCAFYSPSETREWQESTAGRYGGLGIKIDAVPEGLRIVGLLPGGPADLAGLAIGDTLVAADDQPLAGLGLAEVTALLKGAPRTPVRVGFVRGPVGADGAVTGPTRVVVVTRELVRPPTVYVRHLGARGRFLHVRLLDFAEETADAFDRALDQAVRAGPPAGILLDLRENSGGVLGVAVRVADRFLRRGLIMRMQGRTPEANRPYSASDRPNDLPDTPLIVLVNRASASASEVVAGALQDHRRAVLVGERTYGKFLVQSITEIPSRGVAVKLTTSRYYTPSGRSYQAAPAGPDGAPPEPAGLIPDVVVPLGREDQERLVRQWANEEGGPWGQTPRFPEVAADWLDPQVEQALKLLEGEQVLRRIPRERPGPRNG